MFVEIWKTIQTEALKIDRKRRLRHGYNILIKDAMIYMDVQWFANNLDDCNEEPWRWERAYMRAHELFYYLT